MAAQNETKVLASGIFECLLSQFSANQYSLLSWFFQNIWRLLENPKMGLQGIISAWRWFQN